MKLFVTLTLAAWLTGCTTFSPDGGMSKVNELTQSRMQHEATWLRSEPEHDAARNVTRELLAKPISAEDAVKIALLNNRGLQAMYAELGSPRRMWYSRDGCAIPAFHLPVYGAPTKWRLNARSCSICWA